MRNRARPQTAGDPFQRYTCVMLLSCALPLLGQKPDPKPNPQPTPRLADGKVDFGGKGMWAPIWVQDWADPKYVRKAIDVPFTEWGLRLFQERRSNLSKDDPEGYCLPPGVPRYFADKRRGCPAQGRA